MRRWRKSLNAYFGRPRATITKCPRPRTVTQFATHLINLGASGKVRIGTHRITPTGVAIQQILTAMSLSGDPSSPTPSPSQRYPTLEVITTENTIWLAAGVCAGGELYDFFVEKGRLTETETGPCLALNGAHRLGVVHRDLKLESALLDERCHVKLSGFMFTREFEQRRLLGTLCGTTGYAAPEILLCQKYTGFGEYIFLDRS